MSTAPVIASGQAVVLPGTDWRTYSRLLRVFAERPAVRLTYDRGMLEIMSPLREHERDVRLLDRFVVVLTEELNLPLDAGGATTLRRRRKRKGLEADNCYWIANESRVRGKRTLDLRVDPPPDLAVEVDVTHSSLDRLAIYAALQVPEVWRLAGATLTFLVLGADGQYTAAPHSRAFPLVTPADLLRFLALQATLDNNGVVKLFRDWVRQNRPGAGP